MEPAPGAKHADHLGHGRPGIGHGLQHVPADDEIASHTRFTREEALALFEDMIACIRNPDGYAVWQVPILSARRRP